MGEYTELEYALDALDEATKTFIVIYANDSPIKLRAQACLTLSEALQAVTRMLIATRLGLN